MPLTRHSQESMRHSENRRHDFALVLHWGVLALLAYSLVDLAFPAWPVDVALLQPLWLEQKLLRQQQQDATQLRSRATQAMQAMQAIESSSTPADLRRAYIQIPGGKTPRPEPLPQPLSRLNGCPLSGRDRLRDCSGTP